MTSCADTCSCGNTLEGCMQHRCLKYDQKQRRKDTGMQCILSVRHQTCCLWCLCLVCIAPKWCFNSWAFQFSMCGFLGNGRCGWILVDFLQKALGCSSIGCYGGEVLRFICCSMWPWMVNSKSPLVAKSYSTNQENNKKWIGHLQVDTKNCLPSHSWYLC